MSRTLLPLLLLVACSGEGELDQPAPPPKPPEATKPTPVSLPLSGVIDVITVKNGSAEVPGRITGLSGDLKLPDPSSWSQLDGSFVVDLGTWDSGLELRDTRVKETFFEIASHPTATFDVDRVDGAPKGAMTVGGAPAKLTLYGKLKFHGASQELALPIQVQRTGEKGWVVESAEPFTLDSADFGMAEPLEALRVLCAHDSLNSAVTLNLHLALGDAKVPGSEPAEGPAEGAGEADKPAPVKPN